MKKAFLFLTMLLFAFMGTMRADEVTVCDGTVTNDYVPVYGLYADTQGCQSEFVIPASEIGILPGGQISKLTFYLSTPASAAWTATFQVYMTEIEGTTLSAFVGPSGCTQVYQGALNGTGSTMEVVFDNDYTYNGGNLLIGTFVSTAGNYKSAKFYGVTATGASIQRNSSSASTYQRNFLPKTTFEFVQGDLPATTIVPSENPVQLGVRPIGAWMKPYEFAITNQGTPTTVTGVDGTANFAVEAEVPYALGYNGTMPISVTTTGTPAAGTLNGQVLVSYSDRTFTTIDATAEMYEPVDGDVWEMAEEVTTMPFQGNAPTGIYRNYELGQADDAADAVYKVTFDNDVLFSAGSNGAGAKTRLYTEDFNGVGGPDADNNYVYTGPTVNPGPMQMWFSYAYSSTNTWYGTSAGGGFYYGYQIPASYIEELGLAGTTITTVEAAARESYDYECYIIKGGATPFDGELVSFGVAENPQALYFFDINLEEPVLVGADEDIWVIFYSDSPYAAYCGRIPVDATNGKIWTYNPNATSPAWSSNTAYTPVIYTRFIELPTGREVTVDLGTMTVKSNPNAVESEIAAVDGTAMGVSKAQMYNEAKAQNTRGNRDTQTLIEEGWEDGIGDWTMNNCESGTGVYTGAANNGSNCFRFKWTTNTPQYLISPELTDNNGGTMSFYCRAYTYTESYRIGYSTTTDDISAFTFGDEVTVTSQLYAEHAATFPAGTKYVAIASTAYDAYYFCVDDITITADVTSGGGSTDPVYQIADMYVPAGTYYVAVASKTENFQVDMMTSEVPVPEQAVVVSPYDGQTNVSDPYLAEWILGDYTAEMQVLFGTQYPPQTALIDWTDYLVESAFLLDLEPNQSYFMQVNARNAAGTTMGEIIAFTTPIDAVEGFAVENDQLYPGEAAVFTWEANRSLMGYNLYKDGVKVNETPITENTYAYEGLEYNMPLGSEFTLTAVYAAGESAPTEPITVYMTGTGVVMGHVYDAPDGYDPADPDQSHPVAGLPVTMIVLDQYMQEQEYEFVTDEEGMYTGEVLAGLCVIGISQDNAVNYGYAVATIEGIYVNVAYEDVIDGLDIYTHEYYYPLSMITATEEENDVLVEWAWTPAEVIVDFETGDFSQAEFTLPATYPWAITTTNPHTGTYGMKSTCEGVASGTSSIEATVEVPYDAKMGFWVKVSSETNYDKFHFYIDGVEQGSALSGALDYQYKEYTVAEGTHTYKWEYAKDSSVNSNDDCVYVDDITLFRQDVPVPPTPGATTYTFDNSTMEGWTSLDANNDGYGWVLGSEAGGIYLIAGASLAGSGHNESADMVVSGSFTNYTQTAITPDNYLVAPAQMSVQDGASISFWACGQDSGYPAEHFGVAVSTGAATASEFTMVQEWTLTAKNAPAAEEHGEMRGSRAQGTWYNYSADLSSYAGQDIWVAIRHFNCNDEFLLDVDDITLYDGTDRGFNRGDRSFASYNLYRRNNLDTVNAAYEPTLIASGLASDVMSYVDNDWATLPYGEYQWGIQATYEGYAPVPERSRETATFGFEGGLEGWTGIVVNTDGGEWLHSDDNLGGYDYSELAHTGTGFAICYSFVDYVGSFDTDAYLVSPQKYSVDANSSISFWADNANDSYPENFSVCVSTAETPTAASFTQVWSGGAKGTGNGGAAVRRSDNRYENWRSHEISLADYAGQEIWIAFHDVNYDMYEIWIDDVTINYAGGAPVPPTPGPTGDGLSEILWSNVVDKDMIATVTFNVALNNGQSPEGAVIELEALANEYEFTVGETGTITEEIRKGEYLVEIELEGYVEYLDILEVTEDAMEVTYVLDEIIAPVADFYVSPTGWAMWEGAGVTPTPPTPPTPGEGQWYFYGDETMYTGIGAGAAFYWAVMFPAGSYEGNMVTKVANYGAHDDMYGANGAFSGTVTIYNDGTTSPANAVGTMDITMPDTDELVEFEFAEPVTIDPTKNLWVVFYNATSADYVASACVDAGDANARWVSLDGTTWQDLALAGVTGASWMIKVYVAEGARGEVVSILDPMQQISKPGTLAMAPAANRAPMSYKVFLEDVHVGDTKYPFFQVPVEGLVEGETYTVGVAPLYATGMGETMYATFVYSACENYDGATSYSAAVDGQDVTLTWTLPGTPGPGPGPQPGPEETFDFDDSTLQGWTTIDGGSPSGYGWHLGSTTLGGTGNGHNGSADLVISQSYDNNYGVIYPDNYLISPAKAQYAQISFWACGQDANYAAEHFGVAVSTGSATASDFVMVNEWTIGQKGERYEGPRGARAQSTWTEYTADLSAYAGQEIWVAIRHFNCSDMFYLDVDDITLTSAAKRNRSVLYEAHFVTDPGAMANGADASWIKNGQSTWGPNINNGAGYKLADDFTLDAATTITEIEVYGYQTGSTTTSTFTGLYAQIYNGAPNAGGQVVWGDETSNIMTSTSFTNCYRGSDGETTATTRPLMAITAENLNIELEAGTYYLVWSLAGSASSGPWAGIEALPGVGNTGDGIQYSASSGWVALTDGGTGTPYGGAFKLVGEGGGPVPPTPGDILGVWIWRDGEPLTMAPVAGTTFVDNDVEAGEHDYAIRVVYSDYAMACEQIETVTVSGAPSCDPVINPNGYYMNYQGQEGLVVDWTDPEGVTAIGLYEIDGGTPVFIGNATPGQHPIFLGFEGQVPACTITIGFVAVYADCESEMVTCDIYYDAVDEQEVVNAIYPNPTSGDLHVNATAMTHVTVYNAMGQMVYDQEVSGDELILNMGQYEAGVYMVKVTTETGSSVKRINVVR
ncbi:MAG: choice-of-anchor J domain-containing protein [Bacteroidales bacterium]|nr:choice-of-anchor J domain-containing protein [Bacteroidales bacterium]